MSDRLLTEILRAVDMAPLLIEVPVGYAEVFAEVLAKAWGPSTLIEDHRQDFLDRLATSISEGLNTVLVVFRPSSSSDFLPVLEYPPRGTTSFVPIGERVVAIHDCFRICCVIERGSSSWTDEWRIRMQDHWLYRLAGFEG